MLKATAYAYKAVRNCCLLMTWWTDQDRILSEPNSPVCRYKEEITMLFTMQNHPYREFYKVVHCTVLARVHEWEDSSDENLCRPIRQQQRHQSNNSSSGTQCNVAKAHHIGIPVSKSRNRHQRAGKTFFSLWTSYRNSTRRRSVSISTDTESLRH